MTRCTPSIPIAAMLSPGVLEELAVKPSSRCTIAAHLNERTELERILLRLGSRTVR